MNERKTLWRTIRERRKTRIEHIMRNNEWITTIMKVKIRGRPRTVYETDHIRNRKNHLQRTESSCDGYEGRSIEVI